MKRRALVTGISGQDGGLMAELLLRSGVHVLGLSQDPENARYRLPASVALGLDFAKLDVMRSGDISTHIEAFQPDMIFNFAARATGNGMFDEPEEMMRINGAFVLDILEAIRTSSRCNKMRFVQASSSEMFGEVEGMDQDESTPLRPKSPYGAAKAYAHHLINIYRNTWGVHASSAILYNHESIRRSTQFVTRKIARAAVRIKLGFETHLQLGTLDATRDWGHAEEYMEAMYRMVQAPNPDDYVVATGKTQSLKNVCDVAFSRVGLAWQDYVKVDESAARTVQSTGLKGNPAKIDRQLGWRSRRGIDEIMIELVDYEMKLHLEYLDAMRVCNENH